MRFVENEQNSGYQKKKKNEKVMPISKPELDPRRFSDFTTRNLIF